PFLHTPLRSPSSLDMTRHPRRHTLFPYTTLFRSEQCGPRRSGRQRPAPGPAVTAPLIRCSFRPVPKATRSHNRTPDSRSSSPARSEEHTSELQSRFDLVCRLLLEKKKTNTHTSTN